MAHTLEIFGIEYPNATGIKATDGNGVIQTYVQPEGTKNITENGNGIDVAEYASVNVSVPTSTPSLQTKTVSYTPSETAQTDTVTADSGYDGLDEVDVTVNAISSTYVGSGITRRSSTDLTASGATVTAAAGYYSSSATKTINEVVFDDDPSVSYSARTGNFRFGLGVATAGYLPTDISASFKPSEVTGLNCITSDVTITPTESQQIAATYGDFMDAGQVIVSGISSTYVGSGINRRDSTDLTVSGATVTVPSGYYSAQASKAVTSGTAGTPTATKGAVSNHQVSVTPSVTNTTGYITGSTKTGTAVTVSASELVSGTLSVSDNGTSDCTNYASVNVNIPFVTYYTGTSTPASSLGSNGDIYLKVVS